MRWKNCSNNVGLLPAKSVTLIINNLNYLIMKSLHTFSALCALLVMFAVQQTYAQTTNDVLTSNNVVSVNDYYSSTDEVENFINFEVEVQEAGDYYAQFWLLPARYADNSFTAFKVYVNGKCAGSISPKKGNWQAASVDNRPALKLTSGKNVISVSTQSPEIPQVETVRISKKEESATISSAEYDKYLEQAMNSDGTPESSPVVLNSNSVLPVSGLAELNVPVKYSFYKELYFEENQEIFITSSSDMEHVIDFFFAGPKLQLVVEPINAPSLGDYPIIGGLIQNPKLLYTPATSDEMQSYTWLGPSEKAVNDKGVYMATVRAKIPKSGYYMVKLRTTENKVSGTANLNVNGTYYYDNAAMYYAYMECEMPADGNAYAALTMANNDNADPMIFIEDKISDRVVGFDDDASLTERQTFGLRNKDAYIRQVYKFPTGRIHVCNRSSLFGTIILPSSSGIQPLPQYQCAIIGKIADEDANNAAPAMAKTRAADNNSVSFDNGISITPLSPELSSTVTVSSRDLINNVSVYDLSGVKLASVAVGGYSADMTLAELGIRSPGIYIVNVESESGNASKKISVR